MPALALLALEGGAWIAAHVIEVAAVSLTCGALAFAAVAALVRWGDRRDARQLAGPSLMITRADTAPALPARVTPQVTQGTPPAIENHFHFGDEEAAVRILRRALAPQPPAREELAP